MNGYRIIPKDDRDIKRERVIEIKRDKGRGKEREIEREIERASQI